MTREANSRGVKILKGFGVDVKKLRQQIETVVKRGLGPSTCSYEIPRTPRAKKVIKLAIEEAQALNHNYVGTEHMLLGLLRETDGIAYQVLKKLGVRYTQVRSEIE